MSTIPHPWSMTISLFFVINTLGNIPFYIGLLARYEAKRQRLILLREFILGLSILLLFSFFGNNIFLVIGISEQSLGIAGGILLLLIAITMIFPHHENKAVAASEPILVPLATPVIAGPGSITTVMLFASQLDDRLKMVTIIVIAMTVSCALAMLSSLFRDRLGKKGLIAFERLGGMIISLIAVQMITQGIIALIKNNFF